MAPTTLTCKECGQTYPLEARYVCEQCFGPLEVAYDHSGLDAREAKRKIQAGPADIWRYADFLPLAERPRDPLQPGLTPLLRADRLAERLGLGELWIKNDAANPTHSFKDRVVAVALAKARELGFETVACASTGNLANAVAAHAAAAGLDSYVFVPADLEEQKLLATGVYGTTAGRRPRQLRRRQPALHRALRDPPVGVRERQPAPVLLGGLEDDRLRARRAARLVAARPGRVPDRLGLAVHEDRQGHLGVARAGPRRGRAAGLQRRPGGGLQPGRRGLRGRPGCLPPAAAARRSRRAWRSATRPTAPYALELARQTDGSIESVTDDEIRAGIRLLAETTGIFTETAGGVTTAVLAKLAEAGAIGDDERVVAIITGEGLKTLDAVREGFVIEEIEPTLASFEAEVGDVALTA